jgi:hypothetical protein
MKWERPLSVLSRYVALHLPFNRAVVVNWPMRMTDVTLFYWLLLSVSQDTDFDVKYLKSKLESIFSNRSNICREYTGCFKMSFTTLKADINLFRGHVQCFELCRVFQKEPYNDIPNVIVWRVLRKHLHLSAHKPSSRCWRMDSLYFFKCKCFPNIHHTVTFGIPLYSSFWNILYLQL